MADTPQNNPVIREIVRQGQKLPAKVRRRYIAAALETGRIETGFKNVGYGDADSVNWRQERASIYGGDMSLSRSVKRFFDEAAQHDKGQASYELAADVQRPAEQYRGRYKNAQGEALGILRGGGAAAAAPTQQYATQVSTATPAVPGVDNSGARAQAALGYIQQGGVGNKAATLGLVAQASALRDVPGSPATYTSTSGSAPAISKQAVMHHAGAQNALSWAESKVGAPGSAESGGENHGKLADYANSRFGMSGQAWCAMFTSLAVTKGGAPRSARTASVADVRRKALAGDGYQKGLIDPASARPGDLVLFGDRHIGMVKAVKDGRLVYVGGNQSDSVTQAETGTSGVSVVRPKYGNRK